VLHSAIEAASQLNALATGLDHVSNDERLATLRGEHQAAEKGLEASSQAVASLDKPIGQLTRENETDSDQVAKLRGKANDLYRRANELGRMAGFESFKQATDIRREAEQIERRMAGREIELGYRHQPESNLAQSRVESHQRLIEQIEQAQQQLAASGKATTAQVEAVRAEVGLFREAIGKVLDEMNRRTTAELAAAYETAIGHFEKSASQGDKAASKGERGDSSTGRLAATRARRALGGLQATRAASLGEHVALLNRLAAAGDGVANQQKVAAELQAAELARQAALQEVEASYTAALESLEQVSSREQPELVESLKASIAASLSHATGKPLRTADAQPRRPKPADAEDAAADEAEKEAPAKAPVKRISKPSPPLAGDGTENE
jgi:hypothetical protein